MPLDASGWVTVSNATLYVAIAAWLTVLAPSSRLHRAFALFLVLRGASNFAQALKGEPGSLGSRLEPYFHIPLLFAALHFGLAYRDPTERKTSTRWAPGLLAVAALAFVGLYLADHDLWSTGVQAGPLILFSSGKYAVFALIALLLAADAFRAHGARRWALLLVSLGFSLSPAFHGPIVVIESLTGVTVAAYRPDVWVARMGIRLATIGLVLLLAAYVARAARRASDPAMRAAGLRYLAVLALPALLAVGVGLAEPVLGRTRAVVAYQVGDYASSAMLPLLVAYALVRHRLFDLDVTIKWTIRRGTVAAAFLAVFLVVARIAEEALSESFGLVLGGAAAGLLVFALGPLQRWAERVAEAAMPGVRPARELTGDERVKVYREQVLAAWADGTLEMSERVLLDKLREHLGIGVEEAQRVEGEVLRGLAG